MSNRSNDGDEGRDRSNTLRSDVVLEEFGDKNMYLTVAEKLHNCVKYTHLAQIKISLTNSCS